MLKRVAALAGLAAVAAAVAAAVLVLGPLPSRRGTVAIRGLTAPVEVRFDGAGIPHVRAILEDDAWRALGWLHASDRLFQMELRRRAAAGRLSEILGAATLDLDRESRIGRHAATARRDLDRASEDELRVLTAYAEGVNAYIADDPLPLEMRALGITPEPWTPQDSLAFGRLMSEGLSMSAGREQAVLDDARTRGIDAAIALADASDGHATSVAPEVREALGTAAPPVSGRRGGPENAAAGSNAWALAGSRTASGKPLLAGDPHLDPERPGVWYAAHLTTADGLDVAGLTLPGVPAVIIGHNGRVAWSLTMNQADDADLYLEKVDLDAGTVVDGPSSVPLARADETILVKGGDPVRLEVLETRHGPLVERPEGGKGLAVARARAWALDEAAAGVGPFLAADRSRRGEELLAAWRSYRGPAVNVCWADRSGGVGLQVAGAIPRRRLGDGRFPVPGWTHAYDWDGLWPAGGLPGLQNPPEGFVASANDDWSDAGLPLPFPGLFDVADRVSRARRLAAVLHRAEISDMRAMQNDVLSPYALRIVASLATMKFTNARAARAAVVLAGWDGRAAKAGPSRLFYEFLREVRRTVAGPLPHGTSGAWVSWSLLDRMITGRGGDGFWGGSAGTRAAGRRDGIEQALVRAYDTVLREGGADPRAWSWGRAHRLAYPHPFAPALPEFLARRLTLGPVALPGEWHTLSVAGFSLNAGSYDVVHIPSARIIVDLGNPDASRIVLPLGQSGQLFDRHASDMLARWASGRDVPLPFSAKKVDALSISTLRFVPAD